MSSFVDVDNPALRVVRSWCAVLPVDTLTLLRRRQMASSHGGFVTHPLDTLSICTRYRRQIFIASNTHFADERPRPLLDYTTSIYSSRTKQLLVVWISLSCHYLGIFRFTSTIFCVCFRVLLTLRKCDFHHHFHQLAGFRYTAKSDLRRWLGQRKIDATLPNMAPVVILAVEMLP